MVTSPPPIPRRWPGFLVTVAVVALVSAIASLIWLAIAHMPVVKQVWALGTILVVAAAAAAWRRRQRIEEAHRAPRDLHPIIIAAAAAALALMGVVSLASRWPSAADRQIIEQITGTWIGIDGEHLNAEHRWHFRPDGVYDFHYALVTRKLQTIGRWSIRDGAVQVRESKQLIGPGVPAVESETFTIMSIGDRLVLRDPAAFARGEPDLVYLRFDLAVSYMEVREALVRSDMKAVRTHLAAGFNPDLVNPADLVRLARRVDDDTAVLLLKASKTLLGDRAALTKLLRDAVYDRHLPLIRALLAAGADPNDAGGSGQPMLVQSVVHREVAEALLEAGADPARQTDRGHSSVLRAADLHQSWFIDRVSRTGSTLPTLNDGLIAHWPFDSISEGQTVDRGPRAMHLSVKGDARFDPTGVFNGCIRFADPTARLNSAPPGVLDPRRSPTGRSIAFHFKIDADIPAGEHRVIYAEGGAEAGVCIDVRKGHLWVGVWPCQYAHKGYVRFARPIKPGQWHHLTLSINLGDKRSIKCLLDGYGQGDDEEREPTALVSVSNLVLGRAAAPTRLGHDLTAMGKPFTGWLDDFRVYDRPLTDHEARFLAWARHGESAPPPVPTSEERRQNQK